MSKIQCRKVRNFAYKSQYRVNNNNRNFSDMKYKHKKSPDKTAWELAWALRKYPAQLDEAKKMSREDAAFVLLMWFGMSQVDAYIIAYRPKASRNSIAAMASRKSKEQWVYEYRCRLDDLWMDDKLKFK